VVLYPHGSSDSPNERPSEKHYVELVAISFGRAGNSTGYQDLPELKLNERPKDICWYEFYNVLWISRAGGLAQRRGIGRVHKDAWERHKLEELDLVLE
jgi:hypothetical protein